MKCGNLNFLELSGPLEACNRTALPYLLYHLCLYHNICNMSYQMEQVTLSLITYPGILIFMGY